MKEVLAAASSGDGKQDMSMEKNILIHQPGIHLARKLLWVFLFTQCGLESFQQGYAVTMERVEILV